MSPRRKRARTGPPGNRKEHQRLAYVTLESVTGPAREILCHIARCGRPGVWCERTDEELAGFREFSIGPWPIGRLVVHLCRYHWLERDRTMPERRRVRLTRRAWFRVVLPFLRGIRPSSRQAEFAPMQIDPDLSEREALLLAAYERDAIEGNFYEVYGTVGQTPVVHDSGGRAWPTVEIARIHRDLRRRGFITVAYHDPDGVPLVPENSRVVVGHFAVRLTALTPDGRRALAAYTGRGAELATREHTT